MTRNSEIKKNAPGFLPIAAVMVEQFIKAIFSEGDPKKCRQKLEK